MTSHEPTNPQVRTPDDVLCAPELSREEKIRVLERMAYDEEQKAVAAEEGMAGPEPTRLHRVLDALSSLGAGTGTDSGDGPTSGG